MKLTPTNIKGSALVEFILILPLLLIVLVGIIEYASLFYDKVVITNASREAARYGIVLRNPTYASSTEISNYATSYCNNKLITFGTTTPVTVTTTPSSNSPKFGDTLSVTVSYVYTGLVLYNFLSVPKQQTISATTVMTYE